MRQNEVWMLTCAKKKELQAKIKKQIFNDHEKTEKTKKVQYPECKQWIKEVDEENGLCEKCVSKYESV